MFICGEKYRLDSLHNNNIDESYDCNVFFPCNAFFPLDKLQKGKKTEDVTK